MPTDVKERPKRIRDPRPGSNRPCYGCNNVRATKGQHGYCSPKCRFFAKVKKTDSCWLWMGAAHSSKGYGRFDANGVRWLAHRYVFEISIGTIPQNCELDHLCGNTSCVNPSHLEPVTPEEHYRRSDQGSYNREKTHCPRGHSYSGSNLITRRNRRICRICNLDRQRRRRHAKKNSEKS